MKAIISSLGSGFAGLCCAGLPIALAFLTGIGLGFVINDFVLFPILFATLGFIFFSMYQNKKKHLNPNPTYLAIAGTIVLIVGIFLIPLIWFGIIGIIASTIWDYTLLRRHETCK